MSRRVGASVLLLALLAAAPVRGQTPTALTILVDGGAAGSMAIARDSGYAVVTVGAFVDLGWHVARSGRGAVLEGPGGVRIELGAGTPYFRWGKDVLQLTDSPFLQDGDLLVPVQLLTDFLPDRVRGTYAFDGPAFTLRVSSGRPPTARAPSRAESTAGPRPDPVRVVVIDAGHGGEDPGAMSRSGIQEKSVALGVARALAEELRRLPGVEVHLTRDGDVLVPLWDRGQTATAMKGERPGVLISLHANAFASDARGFETYFLSEARTEHERRVAAIENAPMTAPGAGEHGDEDLAFILRELRNLDHQHWSALLAEMIQEEVDVVHPGPNRGVKQAPLAVITNSLMPSVLVEIGFLSHAEEAQLLGQGDFQRSAGRAIANAVSRFFERYPPGSGVVGPEGR